MGGGSCSEIEAKKEAHFTSTAALARNLVHGNGDTGTGGSTRTIDRSILQPSGGLSYVNAHLGTCPILRLVPALSRNKRRMLFQILHLIAMLEYLLLPERALKEGKTFSDMANELVEIGLFDLKEAEE